MNATTNLTVPTRHTTARSVPAVAAIAMLLGACGTATASTSDAGGEAGSAGRDPVATSATVDGEPTTPDPAAGDAATSTTEPPTTEAPATTPSTTTPSTTTPSTTAPTTTEPAPLPPDTVPPLSAPPVDSIPPVTVTPAPTIPPVFVPTSPCGPVGAIPATATVVSDLALDLADDGTADDRAISYVDNAGFWTLRTLVDGVASETPVAGVGAHAVRVLGTADIGAITPGPEIVASVGGGASTVNVGVFGVNADGCLFGFEDGGNQRFTLPVGATVTSGSGVFCGSDLIAGHGFQEEVDGTWTAWGAAYHEDISGVLSYLPASDDYSEGLAFEDLTPAALDCNGLTL